MEDSLHVYADESQKEPKKIQEALSSPVNGAVATGGCGGCDTPPGRELVGKFTKN